MNEQLASKMLEPCLGANSRSQIFQTAIADHSVTFMVVDDHAITRRGISSVLNSLSGINAVILEAESLESAHDLLLTNPDTDILVLDLILPGYTGCDSLQRIRALHPALPTIIISAHDDPRLIQEAMQLGAISFIPKNSSRKVFVAAMELILAGGTYLPQQLFPTLGTLPLISIPIKPAAPVARRTPTPAVSINLSPSQRNVLRHLLQGKTNREIAEVMQLTVGTVKHYVNTLLRTCGVHKRSQLFLHCRLVFPIENETPASTPDHH
jgi:DNA-binding NarL/FixJ family response regulator